MRDVKRRLEALSDRTGADVCLLVLGGDPCVSARSRIPSAKGYYRVEALSHQYLPGQEDYWRYIDNVSLRAAANPTVHDALTAAETYVETLERSLRTGAVTALLFP